MERNAHVQRNVVNTRNAQRGFVNVNRVNMGRTVLVPIIANMDIVKKENVFAIQAILEQIALSNKSAMITKPI